MKRIITTLAILATLGTAGLASMNALSAAQGSSAAQVAVQQEARTFAIENMTCAMCPITVRKAMEHVEGVTSVEIDLGSRTATVIFDPAVATPEAIAQASTNAGYPATLTAQGG